jgi:glucosamine--fructose-6-phosphate aminotransferase (isomerizing)
MPQKKTAMRCEGRFAFVAMKHGMNMLVGVRNGSPLILGVGNNGDSYLASDTPAFIEHTQNVHYIDDGEIVQITPGYAHVYNLDSLKEIEKRDVTLDIKPEDATKEITHTT